MGIFQIEQHRLDLGRDAELERTTQEGEQVLGCRIAPQQLEGEGIEQVTFGDAAPIGRQAQRQDIAVIVEFDPGGSEQGVECRDHPAVADAAGFPDGLQEGVQGINLGMRHAMQGQIDDGVLVRIVDPASLQSGAGQRGPDFAADGGRQTEDLAGSREFPGPADAVMVHDPGGRQACHIGHPDGLGR